jgi:hypothetical protein
LPSEPLALNFTLLPAKANPSNPFQKLTHRNHEPLEAMDEEAQRQAVAAFSGFTSAQASIVSQIYGNALVLALTPPG